MSSIISFFQKLIEGGWNKSGVLEKCSKINKRGGDDYSVLKSKGSPQGNQYSSFVL